MSEKCIGFGDTEGTCESEAGCAWSPLWCEPCNAKRMEHIDSRLEALTHNENKEPG